MNGLRKIASLPITAGTSPVIDATKLPTNGSGGTLNYLRSLRFVANINYTATAAVALRSLYDLFSVTVEASGAYFGPRNLSGSDLAALNTHLGKRIRARGNGDSVIAGAGTGTRTIALEFRYDAFGQKPSDYSPAIKMLAARGGSIQINIGALPTGMSALSGTLDVFVQVDERNEYVAVPALMVEKRGVDTLTGGNLGRGRLLLALLAKNGTTAFTSGELSEVTLRADGSVFLDRVNPDDMHAHTVAPFLTGTQAGFSDLVGGTTDGGAFYQRVFPAVQDFSIGKAPKANAYNYDVSGTLSATGVTWIVATGGNLDSQETTLQLSNLGTPVSADRLNRLGDLVRTKTASKVEVKRADLAGAIPLKASV